MTKTVLWFIINQGNVGKRREDACMKLSHYKKRDIDVKWFPIFDYEDISWSQISKCHLKTKITEADTRVSHLKSLFLSLLYLQICRRFWMVEQLAKGGYFYYTTKGAFLYQTTSDNCFHFCWWVTKYDFVSQLKARCSSISRLTLLMVIRIALISMILCSTFICPSRTFQKLFVVEKYLKMDTARLVLVGLYPQGPRQVLVQVAGPVGCPTLVCKSCAYRSSLMVGLQLMAILSSVSVASMVMIGSLFAGHIESPGESRWSWWRTKRAPRMVQLLNIKRIYKNIKRSAHLTSCKRHLDTHLLNGAGLARCYFLCELDYRLLTSSVDYVIKVEKLYLEQGIAFPVDA